MDKDYQYIMEKIDQLVEGQKNMAVDIAGLPDKILARTDIRYAGKDLESVVNKLIDNLDSKGFQWRQAVVITLLSSFVSAGLALAVYFATK